LVFIVSNVPLIKELSSPKAISEKKSGPSPGNEGERMTMGKARDSARRPM
jgi:hypothetical protein